MEAFHIIVLFVAVAVSQKTPPTFQGAFGWCRKAECVGKPSYNTFHNIRDLQSVNTSADFWEIYLGLWSTSKRLLILMSQYKGNTAQGQYYEFSIGVERRGAPGSQVKFRYKEGEDEVRTNITFPQMQPWRLPRQAFGAFLITLTRDTADHGHNLTLEQVGSDLSGNKVLLRHRNTRNTAFNIQYIAFAAQTYSTKADSKIFFDCPNPRQANVQFILKNSVPRLSHVDMPTCRPDLCDQCPRVYLPVCSSDSKTYRNECFFMCRRANNTITVLHKGVCMHWLWQF